MCLMVRPFQRTVFKTFLFWIILSNICNMTKIHLIEVYFQVMLPFIYRILSDRTFNWGINSHINDVTCV